MLSGQPRPFRYPHREPGSSGDASSWPACINPALTMNPSARYAAPPKFVPAYIDESFQFPARMPPTPIENHPFNSSQGEDYSYRHGTIENRPPTSGNAMPLDDPFHSDRRSRSEHGWLQSVPDIALGSQESLLASTSSQLGMQQEKQYSLRSALSQYLIPDVN